MKAFKLINTNGSDCTFIEGSIPTMQQIKMSYFFVQDTIDPYELVPHPAPRHQLVITLKGKLKFTVTSGASFVIEPGIALIANDLAGEGHRWEIIDGTEWQRIYLVVADEEDGFKPL